MGWLEINERLKPNVDIEIGKKLAIFAESSLENSSVDKLVATGILQSAGDACEKNSSYSLYRRNEQFARRLCRYDEIRFDIHVANWFDEVIGFQLLLNIKCSNGWRLKSKDGMARDHDEGQ